jgi:hypothetical protein
MAIKNENYIPQFDKDTFINKGILIFIACPFKDKNTKQIQGGKI